MKIIRTQTAIGDLKAVRDYITQTDPQAAQRVTIKLYDAASMLAQFPASGRSGRIPNTRELIISDLPFIIPYKVDEKCVQILAIMHTSRKWPDRF